jgi:putative ABC transport system permease protein
MRGALRVTFAGLKAHRRRLTGTFLAVLLGVAFLAATMTMTATMTSAIDGFFTRANAGTDVVVRSSTVLSGAPNAPRTPVDGSLLAKVRAVDGVAVAEPVVEGFAQIVGRDGAAVAVNGPRQGGTWLNDPALNPYRLVDGRAPAADGEVVVNRGAADAGALNIGDRTTLLTPTPQPVTVVGIATFGDADAFGGTSYVGLTAADAARYFGRGLTSIRVRADAGVDRGELVRRVTAVLPAGVEAVTGDTVTDENTKVVSDGFLTVLRALLGAFAGVALLVAVLSIHNTFAILVAQRTRETALLRAIGASRAQVIGGVVAEAFVVGLLASAAGVAAGYGLAAVLKAVFGALGFEAPVDGLVFPVSAVVVCVPIGVLVTVLAAAAPAVRASRVAPIEALRSSATERTRPTLGRIIVGGVLATAGAVAAGAGGTLALVGAGAVLLVVGAVALAPLAAGGIVSVLGAPLRGITASLARQNARRSPRRTAGAAAALLVGVGVVTLFTVVAGSLGAASTSNTSGAFTGDLAVRGGEYGNGGLSPAIAPDLARLPEVGTAVGVGAGQALLGGKGTAVSVADPSSLARVVSFMDGAGVDVARLGTGEVGVGDDLAEERGWSVGSRLPVRYPDGTTATVTVAAVYATNPLVTGVLMPESDWAPHGRQRLDSAVYVELADGVSAADGRHAVDNALRRYGAPTLLDAEELATADAANVDQVLNLVYVLLAIAVVTALMGIVNTLSLAVHERTRELGLLRAIGATRRQIRSLVRWEAVFVALFGTLTGAALGVTLGWLLVRAADEDLARFAVEPTPLVVIVVGGAVAGLLAGVLPARRAARLNVLRAIASD